jgi:hypothetical protein
MTSTKTNPSETHTSPTDTIDWEACWSAAAQLGAITRMLIIERDYEGAREWALRMASAQGGASPANAARAVSYFELAVLLGHAPAAPAKLEEPTERLAWLATLIRNAETELRGVEKHLEAVRAAAEKDELADENATAEEEDGDERDDG